MTQVTSALPVPLQPSSDRDLLSLFLSLPKTERKTQFADTAQTAEIVGMSRRTIQLWIELGQIRAVRVGKKYHVHLGSFTVTCTSASPCVDGGIEIDPEEACRPARLFRFGAGCSSPANFAQFVNLPKERNLTARQGSG